MKMLSPPQSVNELMHRCQAISGCQIGELARYMQIEVPENLSISKGWLGQFIELVLGADATNDSQPDFSHLGVELKTIPVSANGLPCESTYVCTAPISTHSRKESWETSRVWRKLQQVLWLPVEADKNIPLAERRLGQAILWLPSQADIQILKQDWEELMENLELGHIHALSAKIGTYLHIRPKAAHSKILMSTVNDEGDTVKITPKGFYLRSTLTKKLLQP